MNGDRDLPLGFLPAGWEEMAVRSGALRGLRRHRSAEYPLRVPLVHPGCGHSLSETVVRARQSGPAELSPVALMKRPSRPGRGCGPCVTPCLRSRVCSGIRLATPLRCVMVDASTVREPGKTGSLWRLHDPIRVPSLPRDHFRLTETEGKGPGSRLHGSRSPRAIIRLATAAIRPRRALPVSWMRVGMFRCVSTPDPYPSRHQMVDALIRFRTYARSSGRVRWRRGRFSPNRKKRPRPSRDASARPAGRRHPSPSR